MTFQYTVKARDGRLSQGLVDAATLAEARRQLLERGLYALSLKEAGTKPAVIEQAPAKKFFGSRIGKSDVLMVTCQLSVMSQAGIDLAEALRGIAANCPHPGMKQVLNELYDDVSAGKSVSVAMERHTKVFGESYIAAIAAAEASGTMTNALRRLAELLRNEIRLRGTLAAALSYPLALGTICFLVVGVMFFVVLPQFAKVFENIGKTPPPMTSMLLNVSTTLRENGLLLIASGLAAAGGIWYLARLPQTKRLWYGIQLNNVVSRGAVRPLLLGHTFRLLSAMLQSRVPLLDAIKLCEKSVRNVYYRELFQRLAQEVEIGHKIADTLSATPFIPPSAAQMVQTAERSGKLGEILETVGLFYEEEGERQLQKMVKLLEPVIVVFMGSIVATVVASVVLPLLDVSTVSS
jgi:type II secretory pathway component PulF